MNSLLFIVCWQCGWTIPTSSVQPVNAVKDDRAVVCFKFISLLCNFAYYTCLRQCFGGTYHFSKWKWVLWCVKCLICVDVCCACNMMIACQKWLFEHYLLCDNVLLCNSVMSVMGKANKISRLLQYFTERHILPMLRWHTV